MADLILSVDTALGEVPINIIALIDDTDFKTREESVTFDQSGLDLVFNFIDKDGAFTQTAVTPTDTAGVYDWVNQGNAMYTIEMPASGGGTINNDSEGFGWFSGFATGILPWRGPIIHFAPANIVDSIVDGSDVLDVSVTQLAGVAQSLTDLKDFADAGYDPDTNSVEQVKVNDDVRGTDNAALASVLGALNDVAAAGDVTTADTIMQYVKQLLNEISGSVGIGAMPAGVNPANAVNLFQIVRAGLGATFDTATDSNEQLQIDHVAIEADTDEIGTAGAGLTNINLPNQTMDITGNLSGSVGSVAAGGIAASSFAAGAVDAAALATDAVNEIADGYLDRVAAIDGLTPREQQAVVMAAVAGELSGAATTTVTVKNHDGTDTRIVATVDADGNRSAVAYTLTGIT